MATRKNAPTLADLTAQIVALQTQADALRKKDVAEVIAKVKDAIAHYGLTAADLGFDKPARKLARAPSATADKPAKTAKAAKPAKAAKAAKAAKRPRKNTAAKPAARTVKFKDDQGHTWGGMGKRPDWFRAALAAGKTPEELLAKP